VDSFLCTQSLYIGVWWCVFSYWKNIISNKIFE
jgi:hypothetical protein